MEISAIELVLRNAVQRGLLDQVVVDAIVDRMACVVDSLREAALELLEEEPHEEHWKLAAATEELNDVATEVVCLLNTVVLNDGSRGSLTSPNSPRNPCNQDMHAKSALEVPQNTSGTDATKKEKEG